MAQAMTISIGMEAPLGASFVDMLDRASSALDGLGQRVDEVQRALAAGRAQWAAVADIGAGLGGQPGSAADPGQARSDGGGAQGGGPGMNLGAPPGVAAASGNGAATGAFSGVSEEAGRLGATLTTVAGHLAQVKNGVEGVRQVSAGLTAAFGAVSSVLGPAGGALSGIGASLGRVAARSSVVGTSLEALRGAAGRSREAFGGWAASIRGGMTRVGAGVASVEGGLRTALFPALEGGARGMANASRGVLRLAEQFPALAGVVGDTILDVTGLGDSLGAGATGLSVMTGGLSAMAGAFDGMAGLIAGVSQAVQLGATAFRVLNAAILANPIGAVVAGVMVAAGLIYTYWEPISGFFTGLWTRIKGVFDQGIGTLVATILSFNPVALVARGINALGQYLFGIDLGAAGRKIIGTIIDGIASMAGALVDTVGEVFASVREYMPFSDAKRGPFSDLSVSGAAIPGTLGEGVKKGEGRLIGSLSGTLGTAAATVAAAPLAAPAVVPPAVPEIAPVVAAGAAPAPGDGGPTLNAPITVHVQGGADGEAIAVRVREELEALLRRLERDQGRGLHG